MEKQSCAEDVLIILLFFLLTVQRPLQLLVLQGGGGRQQPVQAVQRWQQVQQVAQQRPRHGYRKQQQRVDDLTQHAASCRHVDHIWRRHDKIIEKEN